MGYLQVYILQTDNSTQSFSKLDPYMDENFIKQAFSTMGETAYGVKIITHRVTGYVHHTSV